MPESSAADHLPPCEEQSEARLESLLRDWRELSKFGNAIRANARWFGIQYRAATSTSSGAGVTASSDPDDIIGSHRAE